MRDANLPGPADRLKWSHGLILLNCYRCSCAGVASAVMLPLAGAAVGVVQLGRGIANTPEAVMSAREGKRWNNDKREWVVENLQEERFTLPPDDEDILGTARDRARASEGALRPAAAIVFLSVHFVSLLWCRANQIRLILCARFCSRCCRRSSQRRLRAGGFGVLRGAGYRPRCQPGRNQTSLLRPRPAAGKSRSHTLLRKYDCLRSYSPALSSTPAVRCAWNHNAAVRFPR